MNARQRRGRRILNCQVTRGTHRGEFMGVPATDREVAWTGILMFRILDGKIVDQWLEQDAMGLMQQLGATPEPGQASG